MGGIHRPAYNQPANVLFTGQDLGMGTTISARKNVERPALRRHEEGCVFLLPTARAHNMPATTTSTRLLFENVGALRVLIMPSCTPKEMKSKPRNKNISYLPSSVPMRCTH